MVIVNALNNMKQLEFPFVSELFLKDKQYTFDDYLTKQIINLSRQRTLDERQMVFILDTISSSV